MKLVYTLYIGNDEKPGMFCGYQSAEHLFDSLLLSSTVSSKHFEFCELYCNSKAARLLKEDGRPFCFSNIVVVHDELEQWLLPYNWAYAKILTYSLQTTPFVHLDYDAIICNGIPSQLLNKKFFFQQKENLQVHPFQYYISVYNEAKRLSNLPTAISSLLQFAMNMGIFGCTCNESLSIIKDYCKVAKSYVIQQQKLKSTELYFKKEQPMFFEQLFIGSILANTGLKQGIDFDTFLDKKGKNKFLPSYRFSHFMRGSKRNAIVIEAIKREIELLCLDKNC